MEQRHNRSFDTGALLAGFSRLLSAAQLQRYTMNALDLLQEDELCIVITRHWLT